MSGGWLPISDNTSPSASIYNPWRTVTYVSVQKASENSAVGVLTNLDIFVLVQPGSNWRH